MIRKALFFAEIKEIQLMLHWLRLHLEKKGITEKDARQIEMAVEEAVVNIMEHGYGEIRGRVEVGVKWKEKRLCIVLRDWAAPFDPLVNAPEVDINAPLEKRAVGGLGIHLMEQVMDELLYKREGNANVLSLIKHLSQMR